MQHNPTVAPRNSQLKSDSDDRIRRIIELRMTAIVDGFRLPMRPELICDWEDRGFYIDLLTGEVWATDGGAE